MVKPHDWYRDQCQTCGAQAFGANLGAECDPPFLGHSVRNRGTHAAELVYSSVSQLETARTCLRKWYFEKIKGLKREQTAQQIAGEALHTELKQYLRTGINTLSPLAMSGKHLLPTPGDDLYVEQEISGVPRLSKPVLHLDGVPFIGSIDLMHARGINKGGHEFDETHDLPGTVEVADHKSAKSTAYALGPAELRTSIQMSGYGVYASLALPNMRQIRLSHHYFITGKRQPAVKSSTIVGIEENRAQWESFTPIIRSMKEAATFSHADDVTPNLNSCDAYGGCPHRALCPNGNPLSRFLESTDMGLLDKVINKAAITQNTPASDTLAQVNELALKETQSYTPAGFADACKIIDAGSLGWPPLNGKAARCRAVILGHSLAQATIAYQGTKDLATLAARNDPNDVVAIAEEMCVRDPELRARALTRHTVPVVEEVIQPPAPVLPPDAPRSSALAFLASHANQATTSNPTPVLSVEVSEPTSGAGEPVKKRGRPAGSKNVKSDTVANTDNTSEAPAADGITLFIDCVEYPTAQSLHPIIDTVVEAILDRYKNTNQERAIDIRCANNDALNFGKWKGVLSALVVEMTQSGKIPPGVYSAHSMGCDIVQTVLTALRPVVSLYVRG